MRSPRTASSVDPARADATCVVAHCTGAGPALADSAPWTSTRPTPRASRGWLPAPCTTVIADPHANAQAVLAQARACHEEGVAVAIFPELCLTGYAIDDLLLQETLLDEVEAAIAELVAASADLRPVLVVGAPLRQPAPALQLRGRDPPGPDPRRRTQVAPAELPRVLRAAPLRLGRRPAGGGVITVCGQDVPFGHDLLFRATRRARPGAARGDLRGHVGAGPAERRRGAGRRDGAREPLRLPDHGGARRGPAAAGPLGVGPLPRGVPLRRRRAGGVEHRPVVGRPDDGLRGRRPARRERALPRRRRGVRRSTST